VQASTAALDHNLGQIAAPVAWTAGYTGRGATVAVLDTGADFTHPDLVGKVDARADFVVDGGDAVDHFGHGTHVASTIAGTGAASDGQRKGVAPDARLLIGKVLDDGGYGTESQVIAGMEWAAPRAKVVNLSLGGEASDGSDPMSAAVDALSEQYGTLFVVAAGNSGPAATTVSTPGAAATALTVGAVDGADQLADFSSRGPLAGTRAAKPELVAPGVDIVAARAAGTSMGEVIDAHYTKASGTSMATPHAAGAAAILAQRYPQWTGAQLKAALVGAADPVSGATPYQVGAGRLNAARALTGITSAVGVVDEGVFAYPQSGTAEAKVAWTNATSYPVTLRLSVSGDATLAADTVTVAANGTGQVTLRMDRTIPAGFHQAVVTARTPAGLALSVTPVAFYVEPATYTLRLDASALPDAPADGVGDIETAVVNLDDPATFADLRYLDLDETVTLRVPAGRYSVLGTLVVYSPTTRDGRMAFIGTPEVTIGGDRSLTMDAAAAVPITATVDEVDTEAYSVVAGYEQTAESGPMWSSVAVGGKSGSVLVSPFIDVDAGTFKLFSSFSLTAPGNGPSPYQYDLIHPIRAGVPADLNYRVTTAERATLARVDERFRRAAAPGSTTTHHRYGLTPAGTSIADTNAWRGDWTRPDERVDYLSPGYLWRDTVGYDNLPGLLYPAVIEGPFRSYDAGSRQSNDWVRQPLHPDWYDDPQEPSAFYAPTAPSRTSGNLHIDLNNLTDRHDHVDSLAWDLDWTGQAKRTLTLYRDGQLVEQKAASAGDFTVAKPAATYTLTYDQDVSAFLPFSTSTSTAWTFRSAGPDGTGSVPLALLSVDYAVPADIDNHPTGGAATFTVHQANGVPAQRITSFELWTSTDAGGTWLAAPVTRSADGQYTATLPAQAISLRVKASGSGGSGIEQTIIHAL
jgi:hypothetical protein